MSFSGCITALVTPFKGARLDTAGLRRNVRFQLKNHVSGLLANGSTGEAPTLSEAEWERNLTAVVAEAHGRVKVIAGAGTNSTAKSIKQAKRAEALGADALLIVAPYYNKPTQEGLYATSARLPRRSSCRLSSTTSRRAASSTSCPPRLNAWPRTAGTSWP